MDRYFIIDTKEMETYSVNNIEIADPNDGGSTKYSDKEDFISGIKDEVSNLTKMLEERL